MAARATHTRSPALAGGARVAGVYPPQAVEPISPRADQWVAVRSGSDLEVILTDHLGSVLGDCPHVACGSWGFAESGSIDGLGALMGEQRYLPFGEVRGDVGLNPEVELSFTGQRALVGTGLIDYHARQYDPSLRVFIQPDPIIPVVYGVQDYNRYSYVHGNPVRFTDPSGNRPCGDGEVVDCEGMKNFPENGSISVYDGTKAGETAREAAEEHSFDDVAECEGYSCTEFVSTWLAYGGLIEDEYWNHYQSCYDINQPWNNTSALFEYLTKILGYKAIDVDLNSPVDWFAKNDIPAGSVVFYDTDVVYPGFDQSNSYSHAAITTGNTVNGTIGGNEFYGPEVADHNGSFTKFGPHFFANTSSKIRRIVFVLIGVIE